MRVLVVLTSPLGDIIHALPAISDAKQCLPNVIFDWVVDESFAEVPTWHNGIDKVITTATRRWRKHLLQTLSSTEWRQFKCEVKRQHYDLVIDCQGLIKSACVGRLAGVPVAGFEKGFLREPMAAWLYQHKYGVDKQLHSVERMRQLFAKALHYQRPKTPANFGIEKQQFCGYNKEADNVVFIHSSTRGNKLYPESYWRLFAQQLSAQGFRVRLPWSKVVDRERAERISQGVSGVEVLPKLNLRGVACVLAQANAVVALDTGIGHLSAALGVPTLSLYNSPQAAAKGTYGSNYMHAHTDACIDKKQQVQALSSLEPREVLVRLAQLLNNNKGVNQSMNREFQIAE